MGPQRFVENGYLPKFVQFLIKCLEIPEIQTSPLSENSSSTTTIEIQRDTSEWKVDPDIIFSSIGDMAIAVGHFITSYTEMLVPHILRSLGSPLCKRSEATTPSWLTDELEKLIRQQIPQQSIQRNVLGPAYKTDSYRIALDCTIKLVKAAGPTMVNHVHSLIDRMFMGLSIHLSGLICLGILNLTYL